MSPECFQDDHCGKRSLVENYDSGLKRSPGSTLNVRKETSLLIEATFKVLCCAFRR